MSLDVLGGTIVSISKALQEKKISAVELTQVCLDKIKEQANLNAVLATNPTFSLEQAKRADTLLNQLGNESGPLLGIPIAHKDVLVTKDFPTTAASNMLKGYQSPFDATVVEKLAEAGMVSVAKTNCDEFAMGSSNENSAYGPVKNPWSLNVVPGGSSGGSAAVVASRAVPAATGTDTGGSIRQPASFCGITGIKPTYGLCSRYGLIAYASSLDQAGPMAKTAEDCAILLSAMVGSDDKDSTSLPGLVKKDYWKGVKEICSSGTKPLTGIRLGIAKEHFSEGLSAEVHWALQEALKVYEGLGAKLVEISLPLTHLSIPAYYVIAAAEASSNLSRFDGVRYGYHSEDGKNLDSLYVQSRSEGFGEEVKRRILTGTFVLSHGYYDAYYNKALMVRQAIRSDFDLTFTQCDVVFAPTSPVTAWNLGEKVDDPVSMYLADIFTLGVNLAGLPALSHPAGFSDKSGTLLPIGAQLIAKSQDELRLLSLAACFQQETDWHLRCPPVC